MSNKSRNPKENPLVSWIITIVMLSVFWPVGLFLLFRMLTVGSITSPRKGGGHPYAAPARPAPGRSEGAPSAAPRGAAAQPVRQAQRAPAVVNPRWGRGLIIAGAIVLGIFGLMLISRVIDILAYNLPYGYGLYGYELRELLYFTGLAAVGAVLLACGVGRRKRAARYRRYLTLIGSRESLSIESLAKAMPVPVRQARDDLQDMLVRGFLPAGYIDAASDRLILTAAGIREEAPAPPPKPKADENDLLAQIRAVNDDIDDEEMSRKIDRIGEITAKILDYQRQHPESGTELRSFLNYYLPTTLKILRSYAQMENQGIEGENITAAKKRIEGMMDQVVQGFERRLDKLFRAEAVDITSDIQVLEQMLQKDGLGESELKVDSTL